MPRKAGAKAEETRQRLLESATKEFAKSGYDHASLRTICANAEVTTGAMYFFFKNKEMLFKETIRPVSEAVLAIIAECDAGMGTLDNANNMNSLAIDRVLELCYSNIDIMRIIRENKGNPAIDELLEHVVKSISERVYEQIKDKAYMSGSVDHAKIIAQWFATIQVDAMLEILSLSLSRENSKKQFKIMESVLRDGLRSLTVK